MRVAALFSGGKDSSYAIYIAKQWGWDVSHLVSIIPKKADSWMFHSINIHMTDLLSETIKIPLVIKQTEAHKEEEISDLKIILQNLDIDGVIGGAIASEYQRTRIERVCHELKIKSYTPIWHKNPELILNDQLKAGFEIMIVGVFAYGLDKSWLGRMIDEESISELIKLEKKYRFNIAGEGGEYETLVINGPIFQKKVKIDNFEIKWKRDHGYVNIKKAHLE